MSHSITIEISDAQYKAFTVIALSPQAWVQNVAEVRANKAINQLADQIIQEKLANGETISGTKEQIVLDADLMTAEQMNAQSQDEIPE